jgi:hypothetical protein
MFIRARATVPYPEPYESATALCHAPDEPANIILPMCRSS